MMRCPAMIVTALLVTGSAFAQTSTATVQQTANPELVGLLGRALNATPAQAEGAAGSLFAAAKSRINTEDWSQIASAVPGMPGLLKAAPPIETGTSGTRELGALANAAGLGGIETLGNVVSAFKSLGLRPEAIADAVPILSNYVRTRAGSRAADLLADALK